MLKLEGLEFCGFNASDFVTLAATWKPGGAVGLQETQKFRF